MTLIKEVFTFLSLIGTPIIVWLLNKKTNTKVDELHKEVNSKLSQLVVAEKGQSHAEGKAEGRKEKKDEIDHEKSNN